MLYTRRVTLYTMPGQKLARKRMSGVARESRDTSVPVVARVRIRCMYRDGRRPCKTYVMCFCSFSDFATLHTTLLTYHLLSLKHTYAHLIKKKAGRPAPGPHRT